MLTAETETRWDQVSRQARMNMGLGRDKFARLLQVSPRTVMRWENGMGDEEVLPQSVQRMKLLALSLDPDALDQQQEILSDLLRQATDLRSKYEAKATTIKVYGVEIGAEAPDWFHSLCQLKREENWTAILLMGPHFLPDLDGAAPDLARALHPHVESVVCMWIGNAAFMSGNPSRAIEFYDRALVISDQPAIIRCVLWSNKGYALMRVRALDASEAALHESLRIDPAHRGALRNCLALHSVREDEKAAYEAAWSLLDHFPDAGDPDTELGQLIRDDPDLKNFRATESFARAFPRLSNGNGRTS